MGETGVERGGVVGKDVLEKRKRPGPADDEPPMWETSKSPADLRVARCSSHDSGPVLDGHVPAAEIDHGGPQRGMPFMQNGFQKLSHRIPSLDQIMYGTLRLNVLYITKVSADWTPWIFETCLVVELEQIMRVVQQNRHDQIVPARHDAHGDHPLELLNSSPFLTSSIVRLDADHHQPVSGMASGSTRPVTSSTPSSTRRLTRDRTRCFSVMERLLAIF